MLQIRQLINFIRNPGVKSAGIYIFSNFFVKAIAFLLLFVYSNPKYISVNENGLLSLLSSAVIFMMPFLSMGTIQSTNVDFFTLNSREFKNFFTTSFVFPLSVMFLGMGAMLFFKNELWQNYGFPLSFIFIIPILTFLSFCNDQFVNAMRNNNEPAFFFKTSMLKALIEISLSLILVITFAWRWQGRVAGILLANIILTVIAIYYFYKKGYLFGYVKLKYLKSELTFALPIILFQISTFCLSSSDKFFLSSFTTNEHVGIYGYASVFASVVIIACSGIISYVRPKLYYFLSQPKVNYQAIKKYFIYYSGFCVLSFILVIAVTPILYKYFINYKYFPGLKYMYLIALGYLFWSLGYFFYSFLLFRKLKLKISLLSIFSVVISLLFNYFFIKNWNEFGAAVSIALSYLLVFIATVLFSYKEISLFIFSEKV